MNQKRNRSSHPHVLVVGAGFGGLTFCQKFGYPQASITLVDRQNHHLFQPLLYQVATAGLSPADIASPIRRITGRQDAFLEPVVEAALGRQNLKGRHARLRNESD